MFVCVVTGDAIALLAVFWKSFILENISCLYVCDCCIDPETFFVLKYFRRDYIYKKTQTTTKPSNDRDVLRVISSDPFDESSAREREYVTAMPPTSDGNEFDKQWFENWYKSVGQEYLNLDPRIKEHRQKIAAYNGWENEWVQFVLDNPIHSDPEWIYFLALHYSRYGSKLYHVYSGIEEGMHRSVGIIQASVDAMLQHTNGIIDPKSQPLTAANMKINGLQLQEGVSDLDISKAIDDLTMDLSSIENEEEKQRLGSLQSMVNEPITIKVYYMNNPDAPVPMVMKAIQKSSQAISNAKLNSSHPSTSKYVGDVIRDFFEKFNESNIKGKPDTSNAECTVYGRRANGIGDKITFLKKSKISEEEVFPSSDTIGHADMKRYINDPFDRDNVERVEELLSFPDAEGDGTVRPPYYIDYLTLVNQPAKNKMTGEIANAYILVPLIMHILWAGLQKKTTKTTQNDKQLQQLITYTLKYHCGGDMGHKSSYTTHRVLPYCCPHITSKKDTICGDNDVTIIGATLTIVFMVNAAIANTSSPGGTSTRYQTIEDNLKRNAELLRSAFYKLENPHCAASVVFHFGEVCVVFYVIRFDL